MSDPLDELFPVLERDDAPPVRASACPACRRPMHFCHYDTERVPLGTFPGVGVRVHAAEVVVIVAISAIGVAVGMLLGAIAAVVAMVVAALFLHPWMKRRIEGRAVWRCTPCGHYFVGPPLRPWKAP